MNISGGHSVVKVLEREGVKKAFCVPGESYLGVIDGLYEHQDIQLISTRHEGAASFMAEAYGKTTGEVGVCMATRGPGATNLSIGLHTAMQDSTPLVALIGQVERPYMKKEAFQEVDIEAYFSHLCKWSIEIDSVERIPELLHRAFYVARSGRPGPVVVSLPHDMLEDVTTYKESSAIRVSTPTADGQAVKEVVNELDQAKQPVIIAGGGIMSANAEELFKQFVEKVNVPVVSAFRRFNVLENTHPNYAGWLGFGLDESLVDYIQSADLVLVLGTRLSQVSTQDYTLLNEQSKLIQVDICESSISKAYDVDFGVVSDAKAFLEKALTQVEQNTCETRQQIVEERHQAYIKSSTPPAPRDNAEYVELNSVIADLNELVPSNSIITSDAGNFYGWMAKYFRFTDDKKYVGPTSGAMGYGLPAALGAKVAKPNKTVISFSGDGGFMMTGQELETAARENINVIAIVVNNNMFGTIRAHQENHFPGRVISTPLTNPSFAQMASLYGCEGATVTRNEDFKAAFKKALDSNKPYIIEVQTDPEILSAKDAAQ